MFPSNFQLVVVVAFWLSVCNFHFETVYGDASGDVIPSPTACVNCQVSPPLSGYPSYGDLPPPPPPPPPPPSGYSIYGAPPSPKSKCPPTAAGGQCCTPPAPYIYGPPNAYGPPNPYAPPNLYGPPNPYTYVPYGEGSASMLLPLLVPSMMLFSYFIFLF